VNDEMSERFGRQRAKTETLFEQIGEAIREEVYEFRLGSYASLSCNAPGFSGRIVLGDDFDGPTRLAPRRPSVPITPTVVVTLATLGAFEWLRHRKAEVAAAEASGDYTTLIQEFVTWLRGLLQAWREAASK